MRIESSILDYTILSEENLLEALKKISRNKSQIIFCVNDSGVLEGVMTDGDFRRWVIANDNISMEVPVREIMQKEFFSLPLSSNPEEINSGFDEKISAIPLVDKRNRICAIAWKGDRTIRIGNFEISHKSPTFIIAEIGVNHNGDVKLGKKMIEMAGKAGADCVKFQMRNMKSLYGEDDIQFESEDLGSQYTIDLLNKTLLSKAQMFELFDYCYEMGVIPLCTPWDLNSVQDLIEYNIPAFKIASADLTNTEMIEKIVQANKPVIMSTGMSREDEIVQAQMIFKKAGTPLILLHCNSTYPAPFKDLNMRYLARLKELCNCPIGYSGHERGFHIPLVAVTMGAKVIEKHFTTDRTLPGRDHKVSLLPEEFAQMVQQIRSVEMSLGTGLKSDISQGEMMNREILAKSLCAATDITENSVITREMITIKSPGKGLQPNYMLDLIGKKTRRAIRQGGYFYVSDTKEKATEPKDYAVRRKWGVPVRFHDFNTLLPLSNMDFVEFHLSYADLDVNFKDYLETTCKCGFTVHSPDLFSNDHIINLASFDKEHHKRSIQYLQDVLNLTRDLKEYFPSEEKPFVIASLGGFTENAPLPLDERAHHYNRVAEGISQLNLDGVELLPQTLPPYPWYLGGQLFCNLFVDAEDTVEFCKEMGLRVCFDVSHSKLACNEQKISFSDFVRQVGPITAHLHLADSKGTDGEGLQISEGEIDFAQLSSQLDDYCPHATFIPEIWQGHKNDGESFWVAMSRLEQWF